MEKDLEKLFKAQQLILNYLTSSYSVTDTNHIKYVFVEVYNNDTNEQTFGGEILNDLKRIFGLSEDIIRIVIKLWIANYDVKETNRESWLFFWLRDTSPLKITQDFESEPRRISMTLPDYYTTSGLRNDYGIDTEEIMIRSVIEHIINLFSREEEYPEIIEYFHRCRSIEDIIRVMDRFGFHYLDRNGFEPDYYRRRRELVFIKKQEYYASRREQQRREQQKQKYISELDNDLIKYERGDIQRLFEGERNNRRRDYNF